MGTGFDFEAKFPIQPLFDYPCSEEALAELINTYGRPLPEDYASFLKKWNGIFIPGSSAIIPLTDVDDEDEFGRLDRLYGISKDEWLHDLRFAGKGYEFQERVPAALLAIGDDNSWNRVCLSLAKETFGHVFWWHPGEPWEPKGENVPTERHLHRVAPSFSEFWKLLEEGDDEV